MKNLIKEVRNIKTILLPETISLTKLKKQFSEIKRLSRAEARKPKTQNNSFSMSCNLITQYNPLLSNLKKILRKHLPILYSDREMLNIFPENSINITYKRNKN